MTKKSFVGKGQGFKSQIVLKGEFADNKLSEIQLISSNESQDIGEKALPKLITAANKNKSFQVDAVSGASRTSKGFNEALKDIEN